MNEDNFDSPEPKALKDEEVSAEDSQGPVSESFAATEAFEHQTIETAPTSTSSPQDMGDAEPTVISNRLPMEPLPSWSPGRPNDLGNLLSGRTLNHFQLEEFIGGGGMGAVFRARDTILGRTVAVKVLATGAGGNEETKLRFHNEAQSAARLDHPNIARVHYIGEDQGFNYIVFEFLEGKNLRDLIAEFGPLAIADALRFTLQIAEALAHAWQRDIVHRDIKPSNVLATPGGQVKLVDMGLARLRDVATPMEDLTASGVTLGTFDYISPEQARDPRTADIRSDIYSLGCTLYFMLCARPPFQGGTALQKLLMHQADAPPSPREYRPELPPGLEQLLLRMLAKSPGDRFQNPAELIAAIATLADELAIPIHPTTTLQLTVTRESSSWLLDTLPWLVPAALLFISVFLIDYLDRSASSNDAFPTIEQRQLTPPQESATQTGNSRPTSEGTRSEPATTSVAGDNSISRTGNSAGEPTDRTGDRTNAFGGDTSAISAVASGRPPSPDTQVGDVSSPGQASRAFTDFLAAFGSQAADLFHRLPLMSSSWQEMAAQALPQQSAQQNLFTLTSAAGERTLSSLSAAVAAARDGDVIQLPSQTPVRIDASSLPLTIRNKKITLRGQVGMRPVLQIIRNSVPATVGAPSRLFVVTNGAVALENIDVELTSLFPLGKSHNWTLFVLNSGGSVRMDACWLTVHGPVDRSHVADGFDTMFAVARGPQSPPVSASSNLRNGIHLQDVVIRGGDTLISVTGDVPLVLEASNVLLALKGYLYDALQRDQLGRESIELRLKHVTADLGRGGMRIHGDGPYQPLRANIRHCIFIGAAESALVEHLVSHSTNLASIPLIWDGEKNVYDNWQAIYRRPMGPDGADMGWWLQQWEDHWSSLGRGGDSESSTDPVRWRYPRIEDKPLFRVKPTDFLLNPTNEGVDALLDEDRLPPGIIPQRLTDRTAHSSGSVRDRPVQQVTFEQDTIDPPTQP